MKLFIIIFAWLGLQYSEPTLKGTVVMENDAVPGVVVRVIGTGQEVTTDMNGEFLIPVKEGMDNVVLELHYLNSICAVTEILNIRPQGHSVDLGKLSLILNISLSIEEYQKLDKASKKDYEPMQHWGKLIGYIHKSKIDTAKLTYPCPLNLTKKIDYKYSHENNMVSIDFVDFNGCR